MKRLSPRQQEAFDFIRQYIDEHGEAPKQTEIADHLGVVQSVVSRKMRALKRKDAIDYVPQQFSDTLEIRGEADGQG